MCSKSEVVQSLKTTSRAEALIRLRQLDVNLDLKFAETRLGLSNGISVPVEISNAEILSPKYPLLPLVDAIDSLNYSFKDYKNINSQVLLKL
ncbi:DUF6538 domain-containing protein [Photorhabdus namnaonensis]|uniref:DUF6538 domain-containing protein n=1 Tax=Photorhabdus namnaonensis TaxID=1851568 RepID=UPI003B8498A3